MLSFNPLSNFFPAPQNNANAAAVAVASASDIKGTNAAAATASVTDAKTATASRAAVTLNVLLDAKNINDYQIKGLDALRLVSRDVVVEGLYGGIINLINRNSGFSITGKLHKFDENIYEIHKASPLTLEQKVYLLRSKCYLLVYANMKGEECLNARNALRAHIDVCVSDGAQATKNFTRRATHRKLMSGPQQRYMLNETYTDQVLWQAFAVPECASAVKKLYENLQLGELDLTTAAVPAASTAAAASATNSGPCCVM